MGPYRHLVDPHADRVEDRVGQRRDDGKQRPLPHLLRAERTRGIGILDQVRGARWHLVERRALVLQDRRHLVDQRVGAALGQATEDLLLHHRLAQAHVDTALDLAHGQHRVDAAADVVRDPDVLHLVQAGLGVHHDLDHACGVGVRG